MKTTLQIILTILVLITLVWFLTANDLILTKVFAPKYEQVRREAFEQSKAYRQGLDQEIQNMHFEYVRSTPSQQTVLAYIIKHRVANDYDSLSSENKQFVNSLK